MRTAANDTFAASTAGATAFGASLRTLGTIIGAVSVAQFLRDASDAAREFEDTLTDIGVGMSLQGRSLLDLRDSAEAFSAASTQNVANILRAMAALEDTRPEVVRSKEAMDSLTRASIAYAEAQNENLPEVAKSLGTLLNQFKLASQEGPRVVNALAAGSELAGTTGLELMQALEGVGVVATATNISLEETIAALEVMARAGEEGAVAGNQLALIISKLVDQDIDAFNPEIVGLAQAFENLGASALTSAEKIDLFGGARFRRVGEALMLQSNLMRDFTTAVTGTNRAMEQQARQTDDLQGDMDRFHNSVEELKRGIGDGLNPMIRESVQGLTSWIRQLTNSQTAANIVKNTMLALRTGFMDLRDAAKQVSDSVRIAFQELNRVTDTNESMANVGTEWKIFWQEFILLGPTNFKYGIQLMGAQLDAFATQIEIFAAQVNASFNDMIANMLSDWSVGLFQLSAKPFLDKELFEGASQSMGEVAAFFRDSADENRSISDSLEAQLATQNDILSTTIQLREQERQRILQARDARTPPPASPNVGQEPLELFDINTLPSRIPPPRTTPVMSFFGTLQDTSSSVADEIMKDYVSLGDAAVTVFRDMKDEAIFMAEETELRLDSMVTSILQSMARLALNNVFTQVFSLIAGAMFPGSSGSILPGTGPLGPMSPGYIPGVSQPPYTGPYAPVPGNASGGAVFAPSGTPGPDSLLMMARVTPGEKISFGEGGGSGRTVVQVINYDGAPVRTEESSMGNDRLVKVMVGAVASEMARPGSDLHRVTKSAFNLRSPRNRR